MPRIINRAPTTKKFQLILSADLHLRDKIPTCRERVEYLAAQERKLAFIRKVCDDNDATLLIAGDLFDEWCPSPWLLSLAIHYLPPGSICTCGQHDLPARNIQELPKTGLQTLTEAGVCIILTGGLRRVLDRPTASYGSVCGWAFGEEAQNPPKTDKGVKILMWHHLSCQSSQPWPGAEASCVSVLKKKLGDYNLILVGDNHQQFCVNIDRGDTWVVNPGSLMRMSSDQSDFEPAVFGWREDGSVTRIPLPIEKGVVKVSVTHSKEKESRDKRMESYIKRAAAQYETKLSFTKNLEKHFTQNEERDGVKQIVWKAVG